MDIIHMKTFVAVIEEKGFTAAAQRLGVAKSVCSRRITDLETDLSVQLVLRSTRRVVPTDAGLVYYESCVEILDQIETANAIARCETRRVAGRLRLSVPVSYFEFTLAAKIEAFADSYPEVDLDIQLSDRWQDLIADGYHAAVRIGNLVDSSLYARKIGQTSMYCCASPAYVKTHGAPASVEELTDHECMLYSNLTTGSEWVFLRDGKEIRKRVKGRFQTNSGAYLRRLACLGYGIVMLPDFILGDAIETGELAQLLPEFTQSASAIQIVYPQKRNMPATLRAFIDHIAG